VNTVEEHPNIAISGAALITCLGADRHSVWRAVTSGKCGVRPFGEIESPLAPGADGGQAVDLDVPDGPSREARYLRHVIQRALRDAGLEPARSTTQPIYPAHRRTCVLGTTLHGMRAGGEYLRGGNGKSLRLFLSAAVQRAATDGLELEGPCLSTCSACSSSLSSIALGITMLESGHTDMVVAGGYDTISEYSYAGFSSLRLVASGPLRPFAKNRQGMKVGEGYGIVILERAHDLVRRGGRALAYILGYGESSDAHHLTQPHPRGEGAARAISAALRQARLQTADIDLIAAHATGTPDNDAAEHAALATIFGPALAETNVVAFKSHISHTLGAAGATELILSAMAMEAQTIPPCANISREEVEFADMRLATGEAWPAQVNATINLSLGFGGANTAMILGRGRPAPSAKTLRRPVYITGLGVLIPQAIGNDAFVAYLNDSARPPVTQDAPRMDEERLAALVSARRIRRMSGYVKLALAATTLALQDSGVADLAIFCRDCCAILGTTHGGVHYCEEYYRGILRDGVLAANPMLFAEGVPNAASAHLSLATGMLGGCQTIIGSRTAGLDALGLAAARIAGGQWNRAIVAAADEYSTVTNSGYAQCGLYSTDREPSAGTFSAGWGAAALVLESAESFESRGGARQRASVRGYAARSAPPREMVRAVDQVLGELADPQTILSSANGTWLDQMEAGAAGRSGRRRGRDPAVFSPGKYWAECFSAGPLLAIAATLLCGGLPGCSGPSDPVSASAEDFAALASDYNGLAAGMWIQRLGAL